VGLLLEMADLSKPFSLVEKGSTTPNIRTTDQIIDEIGFGIFHIQFLLVVGIAISCEAMELSLLIFLQGCAAVEWNLGSWEKSVLSSAIACGQLIGLFLFGTLSDKYGRKSMIVIGWGIIIVFGMASALSPNVWTLAVLRGFVGIGIASQVIMFDLAVEIFPAEMRGRLLVFAAMFFVLGELVVAGLAYIVLDAQGWRWLVFYTAVPVIIIATVGVWLIPESPRWLVSQGRVAEAEAVLTNICISSKRVIQSYSLKSGRPGGSGFKEGDFTELFSKKFFTVSYKIWPIWAAGVFVFYVIVIAVSTFFQVPNECMFKYQHIFLINSSGLIGVAVATQLIDSIGRRMSQIGLIVVAGVFALVLSLCHDTTTATVISIMGIKASMEGAFSIMWVSVTELYPTEIRATAHTTANMIGRLGAVLGTVYANAVDGQFFACGLAIVTMCAVMAYSNYFLPETKGVLLDQTYDYDDRNDTTEEDERLLARND